MAWLKPEFVCAMAGSAILLAGLTLLGIPPVTYGTEFYVQAPTTVRSVVPATIDSRRSWLPPPQSDASEMVNVEGGRQGQAHTPAAAWFSTELASAFLGLLAATLSFLGLRHRRAPPPAPPVTEVDLLQGTPRRQAFVGGVAGIVATALATSAPSPATAGLFGGGEPDVEDWEQVFIPGVTGQDITFYDVFMLDDKRGFLIGSRQTFLETNDGGKTWVPKPINTQDELPYRLTSISFAGEEGWMVGKPPILLHTANGGKEWERIGLSNNLPGIPILIQAMGPGSAEMCTDQGGIYTTTNTAQSWKAAVEETVDATLNRTVSSGISGASYYTGTFGTIARKEDGRYLAVSSRGNFYMTWEPGQTFWMPHNRANARRIQSMGWRPDGGLWEIGRGGQLSFGKGTGIQEDFEQVKVNSRGFGLLDVGWRNDKEVWVVGGSGTLIKSPDGGEKWQRQRSFDDVAANLYEVKFFNGGKSGFVLGNGGVLLRYTSK